ncbi:MAG: hypothetical protein NDF58_06155 [archaeon YNP-LCB-024-027]|nr:hypothetical protein [Candidatus Culexarchaeum yellowstonense]
MKKSTAILLILMLFTITLTSKTIAQQTYSIKDATLTVYKDGLVHVKISVNVNETTPLITMPLLSRNVKNILTYDENKTPLNYEINNTNIIVYTLGAIFTTIEYDTTELTSKTAGLWTLTLNSTFPINIVLPENSTIIYVNTPPTQISTTDGRIKVTMPTGYCEISYEVTVSPPMDYTITLVQSSATIIQGESISSTITITLTSGVASQITLSAIGQPPGVEISFNPPMGIPPFNSVMNIKVSQNTPPGIYTITIIAKGGGITKTIPYTLTVREYRAPLITPITIVATVGIAVIAAYLIWKYPIKSLRSRGKMGELTEEEAEIIKFLKERGGKALEVELRERFPNIPRTTLWRMVRRLESKGIVKVKKVGLQNMIELK